MSDYSRESLINWFHRTSGVDNQPHPDEVQTHCPVCGGDKLYFNVRKEVGICHSGSCEWHRGVFISDLEEVFGFSPDQGGEWESPEDIKKVKVNLPGWPVLEMHGGTPMTYYQEALDYLRGRGIDDLTIMNWRLTCNGTRIYVPIFDADGCLVNYNSRLLPGRNGGKKYLYCTGAKTSHYILGWKECRDWTELALVENTFVSLAYRGRMHCSTTFGSNVSDVQADAIAESGIRRVVLLWDENAESGADRALRKFDDRGVRAAYWKILGQPDDYPIEWVEERVKLIKLAADEGKRWLDFRKDCQEAIRNGIIY
jgi:hypothetical protein